MDEDFKKDLDERLSCYPPNMHAEEVAEFLSKSRTSAYRLFDSEDFPKLNVPGVRKKIVPKYLFREWIIKNSNFND